MPRVICTLPNASELISGVKFVADRDQMISEECSEEQATIFASIPGYVLVGGQKPAESGGDPKPPVPGDTDGDGKLSAAEKRAARAGAKDAPAA